MKSVFKGIGEIFYSLIYNKTFDITAIIAIVAFLCFFYLVAKDNNDDEVSISEAIFYRIYFVMSRLMIFSVILIIGTNTFGIRFVGAYDGPDFLHIYASSEKDNDNKYATSSINNNKDINSSSQERENSSGSNESNPKTFKEYLDDFNEYLKKNSDSTLFAYVQYNNSTTEINAYIQETINNTSNDQLYSESLEVNRVLLLGAKRYNVHLEYIRYIDQDNKLFAQNNSSEKFQYFGRDN